MYTEIKAALLRTVRALLPDTDIFCEEIRSTQQEPDGGLQDYVYLDIIPATSQTVSEYHTDYQVLVDIAVHLRAENNEEYILLAARIDRVVRPVFCFSDRAVTVASTSTQIVDRVLHVSFVLAYRDSIDDAGDDTPTPTEYELNTTIH